VKRYTLPLDKWYEVDVLTPGSGIADVPPGLWARYASAAHARRCAKVLVDAGAMVRVAEIIKPHHSRLRLP
jgi:hypothetical protein